MSGYSDASFTNYAAERKSTPVYLSPYTNSPVARHSRKHNIVALRTSEAEYIALAVATQSLMASKIMVVHIAITVDAIVSLHTDKQVTQYMISKPFGRKMRKFI